MSAKPYKHLEDVAILLAGAAENEHYIEEAGRQGRWRKMLIDAALKGHLRAYDPLTKLLYTHTLEMTTPWFRLSDLNSWLDSSESEYFIDDSWQVRIKGPRIKQRQQEEEIIKAFAKLGLNPLSSTRGGGAKSGDKAKLWAILESNRALYSNRDVFDDAWGRLRGGGEIVDCINPPPK